jgi:carboxymethylenebutenolidase
MARWDTIQVAGQPMRVYLDTPAGKASAPGVVVIMHGPGLDRFVEDRVENLAQLGYAAIAPDLYHRQGPDVTDMMKRISQLTDPEMVADVDATIAYFKQVKDTRVTDLGVLGFCMGGRITYMLCGSLPGAWKLGGVFYGGNIMKNWGEAPTPFDLTEKIACPLVGFFGADDQNPSPADVKKIDAELTRLGKPHEFHTYDGAGHAFLNFTNAERYRETQGKDAWDKMLAFLNKHLPAK